MTLVAFTGACATEDEQQNDTFASARWTVFTLLASILVITTFLMVVIHSNYEMFEALQMAPPETRSQALNEHVTLLWDMALIGGVALVGLVVIAVISTIGSGRMMSRRLLVETMTSAAVLIPAAIAVIVMLVFAGPFFEAFKLMG